MNFSGKVLALDIATVTGWAYGSPGSVPTFGSIRFGKPGGSRAAAYRGFSKWLEKEWNVRDAQPDLIVYESPAVPSIMSGRTNIDTIRLLIGLVEYLEGWSYEKFELREATVSQVRAHFLGRNMKSAIAKPMTMARCVELGWAVTNTDEADACALWDYQCRFLRPDLASKTAPLFSRALIK